MRLQQRAAERDGEIGLRDRALRDAEERAEEAATTIQQRDAELLRRQQRIERLEAEVRDRDQQLLRRHRPGDVAVALFDRRSRRAKSAADNHVQGLAALVDAARRESECGLPSTTTAAASFSAAYGAALDEAMTRWASGPHPARSYCTADGQRTTAGALLPVLQNHDKILIKSALHLVEVEVINCDYAVTK